VLVIFSKGIEVKNLYREKLPNCDVCKATDLAVVYDMPFQGTHWANCCEVCRKKADFPNSPLGTRIVKGQHPNTDPITPESLIRSDKKAILGVLDQAGEILAKKAKKEKSYVDGLSMDEIEAMALDSVVETADGCQVEPDGTCPHGYRSPLLVLGLM